MNTVIAKPSHMDDSKQGPTAVDDALFYPAVLLKPALPDSLQVDDAQTLPSVMNAICDDCCKNSLQYVLRSDTGHDGE